LKVVVNYLPDNHDPLPQISDYVESMRISLWDTAFHREFNAEKGVHKNNPIEKQLNFFPALKRIVYRYFKFVLFPAHAITKSPAFFSDYKDTESENSMYTQGILKSWSKIHLETYAWYLDCPLKKPPSGEIALRDSLEPSLKNCEATCPILVAKDTVKKQKEPKPKEPKRKAIIVDDSDEDIAVMDQIPPVHQIAIITSPKQPQSKRLREDPPATLLIVKPAPIVGFVTPPKRRSMLAIIGLSSRSSSSMEMIINDSFVQIVEEKTLTKSWPAAYDDILSFLTKVWIQFTYSCILLLLNNFRDMN
jgi:hypothetical protein